MHLQQAYRKYSKPTPYVRQASSNFQTHLSLLSQIF